MTKQLSRRSFLGQFTLITSAFCLMPGMAQRALAMRHVLLVPPTLMLHTEDRRQLAKLLSWLQRSGYQSIGYRTLADVLHGRATLPTRPIIITIDDLGSHYIQPYFLRMADMIEKAGYRGVFGVVTRKAPTQTPQVWRVLRELTERGWELDTHTSSHLLLARLRTLDDLRHEIVDSARMIEDGTGQRPTSLIAPYGAVYTRGTTFDQRIFEVAAEARLEFVVGLVGGRRIEPEDSAPFYVGRVGTGIDHVQTAWWIEHFHGSKDMRNARNSTN